MKHKFKKWLICVDFKQRSPRVGGSKVAKSGGNRINMKRFLGLSMVALVCAVFACKDERNEPLPPEPPIEVLPPPELSITVDEADKSLVFASEAGDKTISVSTNGEVGTAASKAWCIPTTTVNADKSVSVRIAVSKNVAPVKRTATVTLTTKRTVTDDTTVTVDSMSVVIAVEQDDNYDPNVLTWLIKDRSEAEKIGTIMPLTLPNISGLYISNRTDEYINSVGKFLNMYHAHIVKTENPDYPYFIYFFGWAVSECNPGHSGCDAIFLARGKNLDRWEFYSGDESGTPTWTDQMTPKLWKPIITADLSQGYDNWHNGDPSVVYKDGKFFMAYSAYGTDNDMVLGGNDGDLACIMGAESTDGIHWTKSDYPILIWEAEIGKNEPLAGDNADFNSSTPYYGLYHRPSVMYDTEAQCWKMWFDYLSGGALCMGYAENRGDPMVFADWMVIQGDDTPALRQFPNPEVVKIKGKYYAYGDPPAQWFGAQSEHFGSAGWPSRQLVEAQSDDGINWRVTGFVEPDDDTQANHVPTLYYEDGILYLLYATQKGNRGYSGFKSQGNKYYNEATYDFRYFAIRFKVRFLDEQIANGVIY
ncbi:hypothetical protein AGMMS49965_09180 [Bacteroidia bacterium]|nr:hypothetical protein AGMMS49965_09180 [Bacteroidia bacterium]